MSTAKRLPVGLSDFAFYKGLQHYTALLERSGTCQRGTIKLKNRDPFLPPLLGNIHSLQPAIRQSTYRDDTCQFDM